MTERSQSTTLRDGDGLVGLPAEVLAPIEKAMAALPSPDSLSAAERESAEKVVVALLRTFSAPLLPLHNGFTFDWRPVANLATGAPVDTKEILPRGMTQRGWVAGLRAAVISGWLSPVAEGARYVGQVFAVNERGASASLRNADSYFEASRRVLKNGHEWMRATKALSLELRSFETVFPELRNEIHASSWGYEAYLPKLACMPSAPGVAVDLLVKQVSLLETMHKLLPERLSSQREQAKALLEMGDRLAAAGPRSPSAEWVEGGALPRRR